MERSSSTFCQTYIFLAPNICDVAQMVLTWEAKVVAAADAADVAADAAADAVETNWKHKVIQDLGGLMTKLWNKWNSETKNPLLLFPESLKLKYSMNYLNVVTHVNHVNHLLLNIYPIVHITSFICFKSWLILKFLYSSIIMMIPSIYFLFVIFGHLCIDFSEILVKNRTFSVTKMHSKMFVCKMAAILSREDELSPVHHGC